MRDIVPTVIVNGPNGEIRVNEVDFVADQAKPKSEQVYTPLKAKRTAKPEPAPEPADVNALQVKKIGRKHYVVNADGEKVDQTGYADEGAAWEAIIALAD